jgi:hypothetical protein
VLLHSKEDFLPCVQTLDKAEKAVGDNHSSLLRKLTNYGHIKHWALMPVTIKLFTAIIVVVLK